MQNILKNFNFEPATEEQGWLSDLKKKIQPQPKEKVTYISKYQLYDPNVHGDVNIEFDTQLTNTTSQKSELPCKV